ncbi:hypothetical protein HPB48_012432 [Haemaphysalis longicornis]|uniref:Uncharacterized protein n=1 Tax=Haemaphysalis longicornis TaxID=44386 RepID=A0A9J6G187_HAELO|nr:hypothetical protein HPB48_012432 [Haemaphysalis longicornis]
MRRVRSARRERSDVAIRRLGAAAAIVHRRRRRRKTPEKQSRPATYFFFLTSWSAHLPLCSPNRTGSGGLRPPRPMAAAWRSVPLGVPAPSLDSPASAAAGQWSERAGGPAHL